MILGRFFAFLLLLIFFGFSVADDELNEAVKAAKDGDFDNAIPAMKKLANEDNSDAQNYLAAWNEMGMAMPINEKAALKWTKRSAELGNAFGRWNLAVYYYFGVGVEKDYSKVLNLIRPLAKQGYSEAYHTLHVMYSEGKGVPKDEEVALEWFEKYERSEKFFSSETAKMLLWK